MKLLILLITLTFSSQAVTIFCRGPLNYTVVSSSDYYSIHVDLKWHDEAIENGGQNLPAGKCSIENNIPSNPGQKMRFTLSNSRSSYLGSSVTTCLSNSKCMFQTKLHYVTPSTPGQGYYVVKDDIKINNTLFARTPINCKIPDGVLIPSGTGKDWGKLPH